MTRDDFQALVKEIQDFVALPDFKDRPAQYLAYRRQLVGITNDETNDNQTRVDAYILQNGLKWAFNATVGIDIRERLKNYPESTLYSNHESLTSRCRRKIVQLTKRFEFKPQPIALGVKHYFQVNHGIHNK